jgi:single-stranded DNA-binding protein
MLNIEGLVKITKIDDVSEKSIKGIIYFGTRKKDKNGNEEWENSFFPCIIVGKSAVDKATALLDKDPIYITSGLVKNVNYEKSNGQKASYLSVTIFDFEYEEQVIKSLIEKNSKTTQPPKQETTQRSGRGSRGTRNNK